VLEGGALVDSPSISDLDNFSANLRMNAGRVRSSKTGCQP